MPDNNNYICEDCECGFKRDPDKLKKGHKWRCPYCGGFNTKPLIRENND